MLSPLAKRKVPKAYAQFMDGRIDAWDLGRPGRSGHAGFPARHLVVNWHNQALTAASRAAAGGPLSTPAVITQREGMELLVAFLERHGLTFESFPEEPHATFSRR